MRTESAEDGHLARVHYIYTNGADIGRAVRGGGPQAPQAGASGEGEGAGVGRGPSSTPRAGCGWEEARPLSQSGSLVSGPGHALGREGAARAADPAWCMQAAPPLRPAAGALETWGESDVFRVFTDLTRMAGRCCRPGSRGT